MPGHFWSWYREKKHDEILSMEDCFNTKAFLIGCCIEYLIEKGQTITKLHECNTTEDILKYLKTGIVWVD